MQIINKKQILKQLNEQFGVKEIPKEIILIKLGEEKIFAFSGDLQILRKIEKLNINIAGVGCYAAKEQNGQIRLSIEGTHLFKEQINKNIFDLNQEQKDLWMHGSEILLDNSFSKNIIGGDKLENSSIKSAYKFDKNINNKKIIANDNEQQIRVGNPVSLGEQLHDVASKIGVGLGEGVKIKRGFVIMKYKNDFLGTGKASENKIGNFIPKNRRLKYKEN